MHRNRSRTRRLQLECLEPRSMLAASPGLTGEYYNEINLTDLASTRVDPTINFTEASWGAAPPGTSVTPDDNYSERWTGFVKIDTAGDWTFYTTSNDGVRLWIDGQLAIDHWNQHVATEDSAMRNLSAGWHSIRLEHFQQNGTVAMQLSFSGPGMAKTIIPSSHLSTEIPNTGLPTANAGPDKTVVLPANSVTLNGSGSDSNGTITGYQWTKLSGPAATLSGANTANLNASNLQQGTYLFRLTVTDNDGNTAFDDTEVSVQTAAGGVQVSGDMAAWHPTTLTFNGPTVGENDANNPFLNYRLNVTFTGPGGQQYVVAGYFAAHGDAADSSATGGNKWRVHFVPDQAGTWTWTASFRTGTNVAVSLDANAGTATGFNGASGSFQIAATNPNSGNPLDRGTLRYVGEHYLQYAASGEYFIKNGADSPENFLGYYEFDNTFDSGGSANDLPDGLHHYDAHLQDWNTGDPTWQNGEGKRIIGVLNYLASQGVNSVYFLTYNIDGGDGREVFPWTATSNKNRFDVSKLAQWEVVFQHMDALGIQLHVVTQETENDQGINGGALGVERMLYYRELIARFGHHQAVNWNLGEENTNTDAQRKEYSSYIRALDPYDHPIVVHTFPGQQGSVYTPLLGYADFYGTSLQTNDTHNQVMTWIDQSAAAGRPWVVTLDEIGPANAGVVPDANDPNHDSVRKDHLWGSLMAGAAGVEWYFGYNYAHNDLDAEDLRTRENMWEQTKIAVDFFQNHLPFTEMHHADSLTSSTSDYVYAKAGDTYAIYLKNGGTTNLNLTGVSGTFEVKWYNPRTEAALQNGTVTTIAGGGNVSIGNAPSQTNQDWAVLVRRVASSGVGQVTSLTLVNADTDQDIGPLTNGATINLATLGTANLNVRANTSGTIGSVRFNLDGTLYTENQAVYALFGNTGADYKPGSLSLGAHTLTVTPYAGSQAGGAAGTALTISFTVVNQAGPTPGGLQGEYFNNIDLTGLASTRIDGTVNFNEADWGNAPPGTGVIADDNYSERWTGLVKIDTAGSWTFYTNSNDGVRLWIDDQLVIDHWNQHAVTEDSVTLNLSAGWHSIRLEHFQQNGTVAISLSFAGPGRSKTIIPSSHLSADPLSAALAEAMAELQL